MNKAPRNIIIAIIGTFFFLGTIAGSNLKQLSDWSNAQAVGFNLWTLFCLIGIPYIIFLQFKKSSFAEAKEAEKSKDSKKLFEKNNYLILSISIFVIAISVLFLYKSLQPKKLSNPSSDVNNQPVTLEGYWRNNSAKTDYLIRKSDTLEILGEKDSLSCTYEIKEQSTMLTKVWFKCPYPDWPGYAEFHEIRFIDNSEFIDTKYIQGIGTRIDGEFIRIGTSL